MIGVFDSGFGGLVVLREFLQVLPDYDYLYLGDNARIPPLPVGPGGAALHRAGGGLPLGAMAASSSSWPATPLRPGPCGASSKSIYPSATPTRRVLGVLIPTVEEALARSRAKRIGVIATEGTVTSQSFELELKKLDPEVEVVQQACPLLVPLIESGEQDWEGTTMILRRYLAPFQGGRVDTLILGCTHYSILKEQDPVHSWEWAGFDLLRAGDCGQTGGVSEAPPGAGGPPDPGGHPPLSQHRPDPSLPATGQPLHGPGGQFRSGGTVKFEFRVFSFEKNANLVVGATRWVALLAVRRSENRRGTACRAPLLFLPEKFLKSVAQAFQPVPGAG